MTKKKDGDPGNGESGDGSDEETSQADLDRFYADADAANAKKLRRASHQLARSRCTSIDAMVSAGAGRPRFGFSGK